VTPAPLPSGEQHEIAAGGYSAVVTEVGASLRALRHGGRDLVVPWEADEVRPVFRGALLAPWPNRVGDGRYRFGGAEHQLPLSEAGRRCALHGLVAWQPWWRTGGGPGEVELGTRVWPSDGYPFLLDLQVRYAVGPGGLTCTLTARNAGTGPAPWGCAPHPYLVAGPGRVDDWTVEVPAGRVLEVDGERLLPADPPVTRPVADAGLDLRGPAPLAGLSLDHAFTGLAADGPAAGEVAVRVRAGDGGGVEIAWDARVLPWVQVHTGDRPEPELDRAGLAVEPMTCPPDAFTSGTDLVTLAPGDEHTASWVIRALP
jgi:aldose 1-epimerase